jgi:hypothetical protein
MVHTRMLVKSVDVRTGVQPFHTAVYSYTNFVFLDSPEYDGFVGMQAMNHMGSGVSVFGKGDL